MKNFPKILFFINRSAASEKEKAEALKFGPGCVFRHAGFANDESGIEDCDGVAGAVPKQYKHLPSPMQAFETFSKSLSNIDPRDSKPSSDLKKEKTQAPSIPPPADPNLTWKPNA